MSLIKKKKMKKSFQNIRSNNDSFITYLDSLKRFPLEEVDIQNLDTLKEHLNNMSVLFTDLENSLDSKKVSN